MRPREAVGGSERGQVDGQQLTRAAHEDHELLDRILATPSATDRRYFQRAYWGLIQLAETDPDFVLGRQRRRFDYEPLRRAINSGAKLPDFGEFLARWRGAKRGSQRDLSWVELYLERSDVQTAMQESQYLPPSDRVPQEDTAENRARPGQENSETPKSRIRTGD